MMAKSWRYCEARLGGCDRYAKYLVRYDSSRTAPRRILLCDHCLTEIKTARPGDVQIVLDFRDLTRELIK